MKKITGPSIGLLDARYFIVDTRANILATTPLSAKIGLATDTDEFLFYDTNDAEWKVAPLELQSESANPDMGAYIPAGLGISDKLGYGPDYITHKTLTYVKVGDAAVDETGALKYEESVSEFQVYSAGVGNAVVLGFRFREDDNGAYELEHKPVGLTLWYEVMSGNSMDDLGLNGKPIMTQYASSMGAYPKDLILNGGTF